MQYSIDFGYCQVVLSTTVEIKHELEETYGALFPISNCISSHNWAITEIIDRELSLPRHRVRKQLEHNISGWVYSIGKNETIYSSDNHDWLVRIDRSDKKLEIYGRTNKDRRYALTRVLRQVFTSEAINSGLWHFHCACVDVDSNGIVFCGPKKAGKTSIALKLLNLFPGNYAYICNDISVVDKEKMHAVYKSINIGGGTMRAISKSVFVEEVSLGDDDKVSLEIPDLVSRMGISVKPYTFPKIFYFVTLDPASPKCKISLTERDSLASKIEANLLVRGEYLELDDHPDWMSIEHRKSLKRFFPFEDFIKGKQFYDVQIGIKDTLNIDDINLHIVNCLAQEKGRAYE
jgi:hypothetical protein